MKLVKINILKFTCISLFVFMLSCSSLNLDGNGCADIWQGGKMPIDSVFSKQWVSGNNGLIILKKGFDSTVASEIMVYEYNCGRNTCTKSSSKEFDFGNSGGVLEKDPYYWSENTLVMAEHWTITLLSSDKFAYRSSASGDCTLNYVPSEKTFVDK